MPQNITLHVNGREHTVDVEPDSMLLYALRDNLGLHGPKFGCGLAECGACTVVMNGTAIRSCMTPVSAVGSAKVTTLEGLGTIDKPHPLQQAFIEEQAAQCGYCINGMIMAAYALLGQNPHPSRDDIKQALDGNLCRCGTHMRIVRAAALSHAEVFTRGQYPVIGRFNLATPNPNAPDATVRVRGLGLQISTPDGQEWRTAMIDPPFFAVSTPRAFYELLLATASKDPNAMKTFASAHPEIAAFGAWAKSAPWTGSYAEERYNSLNSFVFIDSSGGKHTVRWSLLPAAQPVAISPDDLAKRGPDFLEQEITERVRGGPQRWTMMVTVANPGDPTADPTKAWPEDRRTVEVGSLTVQQIQPERDGPCRDINFDPTVLPTGIETSDDPFPAARSSAYAKSYDRRTAEAKYYPRTATDTKP